MQTIDYHRVDAKGFSLVTLSLQTSIGLAKAVVRHWFDFDNMKWQTSVVLPTSPVSGAGLPLTDLPDIEYLIQTTGEIARLLAKEHDQDSQAPSMDKS